MAAAVRIDNTKTSARACNGDKENFRGGLIIMYYTFRDKERNEFQCLFNSREQAEQFAYKYGYCFCGKSTDIESSYWNELSKKNIKAMIGGYKK